MTLFWTQTTRTESASLWLRRHLIHCIFSLKLFWLTPPCFICKDSKEVFTERQHSPEPQAESRTHTDLSVCHSGRAPCAELKEPQALVKFPWWGLNPWPCTYWILTLPLSYPPTHLIMLFRLKWSSCPSFLSVWDFGCVLAHPRKHGIVHICHFWGRVLHAAWKYLKLGPPGCFVIRGLALKPLMHLCLTFQCDMEAGTSPLVADYHQVCYGKVLKFESMGTL